jgi:phosphomannomutase
MANPASVIISVSGVRGVVGQGLTPELATSFAAALAEHANGGRMVLGRDSRPSGLMLRHAVLAGLLAAGCEVEDLGVVPTPTVGLAVRRLGAAAGIQITASHNPAPWNGLKLFGPDGGVLPASLGKQVQERFQRQELRRAAWHDLGRVADCLQAIDWHCTRVLELVDVAAIRSRGFTVLLDANGGAGGPLGRKLLDSLHCHTIVHGCNADGAFRHEPEPVAANLTSVAPLVPRHAADLGFVLDPDADRLALIDETGRFIGEELTLALAVLFRLRQCAPAGAHVVINMSTSRVIEDIARQLGATCHRAAVGEANVVEAMRRLDAPIGGEGNGGVIDPRVGWVRDPFIGMGLILNLMAQSGKKLSELASELPAYHIVKERCALPPARLPGLFAALQARWPEARADSLDGLRLDWPDRWLHVRPSNTEPIVRIIAEAPTAAEAEQLCRETRSLAG